MAVSLSKGGNVNLTKETPGLDKIIVGLGWDARVTDGAAFDLDASCFLLKTNGKVRTDSDFCFYNNKSVGDNSVVHQGDNLSGEGDGDDECIKVGLSKVPADIDKVVFSVTIHDADQRRQNFGQVSRAYIRIVNEDNGSEIARYDLSEDASIETAMIFGEIYRNGADWKFKAVGQGFAGGLGPLAASFGVNV
ncbi:MAG: TerD family protein [Methylomonas sp.]|nr:TerD family protein [Methylomonas sp.]PPD22068.1 MAG: chemical-damaging agent resistance protein C [Methylomonas sp.]PPD26152.1 MAG: chemical-damaging agent resistance protein C [Methylomonas sp.]PPD37867.1 MAG: chemical-damaging agent resistance protein C [Methylomonas sp.]PPD42444.1 MAG: chemical-damaging agent resistance protein C [Methylomonas sp.]